MTRSRWDSGFAMAALLVAITVMAIMMSVAMPVWNTWIRREREAELIFRAEQYTQAIDRHSRQTGAFPTSFTALRDGKFIRKLYKDPITGEDFLPVYLGQTTAGAPGTPAQNTFQTGGVAGSQGGGPIVGVVSKSKAESIRRYNGRTHYNEWVFVSVASTQQAGGGQSTQTPGRGFGGGRQGGAGRGSSGAGRGTPSRGDSGAGIGAPPSGRGSGAMPPPPVVPGQPIGPGAPVRGRP